MKIIKTNKTMKITEEIMNAKTDKKFIRPIPAQVMNAVEKARQHGTMLSFEEAKMLMNLPKGTRIFRNSMTERIMNNGFSGNNMMTVDENNQLKKLGGFNGLSDYTDSKFGGGINYSSVKADNITVNITNTYGNQSPAQIKDTNNDLVRKINEVLFQKEDRKRRVSIG